MRNSSSSASALLPFPGGRHGSRAAAREKLRELRGVLAERFPETSRTDGERLATGIERIDEALGGGFPKGAVSEVVSSVPSAGGQVLLAGLLRRAREEPHYLALVDGSDGFDPQTLTPELLPYLLWVRCGKAAQALQAADLLVRDGNIPLVILDLRKNDPMELRRQTATIWFRLQRAVEKNGSVLLVFSERPQVASAAVRLALTKPLTLDQLDEGDADGALEVAELRLRNGVVAERDVG